MRSTSRSIGLSVWRSSRKFAASITARPTTMSAPSTSASEVWIRSRASTSSSVAITRSAALIVKTRHRSGSREKRTESVVLARRRPRGESKPPLAPLPPRRRSDQNRHRSGCVEVVDERAAQVPPAEASGARADDDQVGALFGSHPRERLGAIADRDPPLELHAELVGDRRQAPCRGRLAVRDGCEDDAQAQPSGQRARELGRGQSRQRVRYVADDGSAHRYAVWACLHPVAKAFRPATRQERRRVVVAETVVARMEPPEVGSLVT